MARLPWQDRGQASAAGAQADRPVQAILLAGAAERRSRQAAMPAAAASAAAAACSASPGLSRGPFPAPTGLARSGAAWLEGGADLSFSVHLAWYVAPYWIFTYTRRQYTRQWEELSSAIGRKGYTLARTTTRGASERTC